MKDDTVNQESAPSSAPIDLDLIRKRVEAALRATLGKKERGVFACRSCGDWVKADETHKPQCRCVLGQVRSIQTEKP